MCRSMSPDIVRVGMDGNVGIIRRVLQSVGLWPLRGRNGTQAVPYDINAQEAYIQVRKNVIGLYTGGPDHISAWCAVVHGH